VETYWAKGDKDPRIYPGVSFYLASRLNTVSIKGKEIGFIEVGLTLCPMR